MNLGNLSLRGGNVDLFPAVVHLEGDLLRSESRDAIRLRDHRVFIAHNGRRARSRAVLFDGKFPVTLPRRTGQIQQCIVPGLERIGECRTAKIQRDFFANRISAVRHKAACRIRQIDAGSRRAHAIDFFVPDDIFQIIPIVAFLFHPQGITVRTAHRHTAGRSIGITDGIHIHA